MSREIVLCPECKGHGERTWDELVNYHKREYDTHSAPCSNCDGKGRLLKVTTVKWEKVK